jgi:hypothetical protein
MMAVVGTTADLVRWAAANPGPQHANGNHDNIAGASRPSRSNACTEFSGEVMANSWTTWKSFPNRQRGECIEAPIGPGVYEVRRMSTGEMVAFAATGNVAHALAKLVPPPRRSLWGVITGQAASPSGYDLEYRICGARTPTEARLVAERLQGRRRVYWRTRGQAASVVSHPA